MRSYVPDYIHDSMINLQLIIFDKKYHTQFKSFAMKNASSNPSPALLCLTFVYPSSGVYVHVKEEGTVYRPVGRLNSYVKEGTKV